jgi:hypothetical protein
MSARKYFLTIGDAGSQLINAVLGSMNANESLSGRAYKNESTSKLWAGVRITIDTIFSPFSDAHCEEAFFADVKRAKELIQTYSKVV